MEIYVNLRQKADVNPIDVIEKLIEIEIGYGGCILKTGEQYYRGFIISAGTSSLNDQEEIIRNHYEYLMALELVLERLKSANHD